jgi:hypothetical protein
MLSMYMAAPTRSDGLPSVTATRLINNGVTAMAAMKPMKCVRALIGSLTENIGFSSSLFSSLNVNSFM